VSPRKRAQTPRVPGNRQWLMDNAPVYDRRNEARLRNNQRGTTMVVYALADPRDGKVRYIGITNNLLARFNEHMRLSGENSRKHAWLQELVDAYMLPIMYTLEVVQVYTEARAQEVAWIQIYRGHGADLLNDEANRVPFAPESEES